MNQKEPTRGVSLLIGDPKKAILTLSGPMVAAMMMLAAYNLVNAIWVAGLGSDALAAIGFVMPIYMVIVGLSNGLGAGVSSSISRKIGAHDKAGADNTAMHALLITIVISSILTVTLIYFLEPLLAAMGAGASTGLAVEYGRTVFAGSIFIVFTNVAYAVLRGEGDTKRTMYAMSAGSLINVVLDPLLIYHAGMGISGAAWGTIISLVLVSAVLIYWLQIKRDTYVSLSWRTFHPDMNVVWDMLRVGLPASVEFLMYSIDGIIINSMLVHVSGTDAVAVYTAGWRIIMLAIIPMLAIGTAEISVAGAAFGARRYVNLSVIHNYSTRLGLIIGVATAVFTWAFAPQITMIFTYTSQSAHLAATMVAFLHVMCLFYPFASPGIMSASLFQGTGRGGTSLIINMLRDLILMTLMSFILGIVLGLGQEGIWWGIVFGNIVGSIIGYSWARHYASRMRSAEVFWKHGTDA
ncbi:MAG: MATE family efflux transporter [Methanothrix sp.]|nr:MATE family efflux transporter [Methanothrix sp.]